MHENVTSAVVIRPEQNLPAGFAYAERTDDRCQLTDALVSDPWAKVHQVVPARRGVPDPDSLVVACRHDLVAAGRPLYACDSAVVGSCVPVEGSPSAGSCALFAGYADGVVEIERGEGGVGAPNVEEEDAAVGGARAQYVFLLRRPS